MKYLCAVVPVGVTLQLPHTHHTQTKVAKIQGSENVDVLDDSVSVLWFCELVGTPKGSVVFHLFYWMCRVCCFHFLMPMQVYFDC